MQNLLTSAQIRDADAHTILSKPISSLDLMEAASLAFVNEFVKEVTDKNIRISMFCGTGNNGGDGLAVARLLNQKGYVNIHVKIVHFSEHSTDDFKTNLQRLKAINIPVTEITNRQPLPYEHAAIIIDALLGSGLNKRVKGLLEHVVDHINNAQIKVISIDVPSGFPSEGAIDPGAPFIRSAIAISFQRPKISFFFPESEKALERFIVVPIGLDENYIQTRTSYWNLIEDQDVIDILKPRNRFSHKGSYGHALIIAGSKETMGAALLCADACLHSGAGLTTACVPETGISALNTRSPEVMTLDRERGLPKKTLEKYSSIGLGPGLGTDEAATRLFEEVLRGCEKPIVLDADALTLLSNKPDLYNELPAMSILTPHMKEFDRMFGAHNSWWERVETARKKASEFNIIILLKNRYSFIVLPDGNVLINPTGNPAMAVGGMGDVLTGMVAAFLAQGYGAKEAAMIACYLHGKTGDELKNEGMNSIPPRYLIERLPFVLNMHRRRHTKSGKS